MNKSLQPALAEVIGTFLFISAGCLALFGGGSALGVALAFGLGLALAIASFGTISGGHFNPAVTLGLAAAGRFDWKQTPLYVLAQILGASLSGLMIFGIFGAEAQSATLTVPNEQAVQLISLASIGALEVLGTFFLTTVVLNVTNQKNTATINGLAIGLTVTLMALSVGAISGGSFNPARSIGPALVSQGYELIWFYALFPVIGGLLAAAVYRFFNKK